MRLNDSRLVTTFFTLLKAGPAGGRLRRSSSAGGDIVVLPIGFAQLLPAYGILSSAEQKLGIFWCCYRLF
jgi:hypothetical protein